jgi:hypothetical protein
MLAKAFGVIFCSNSQMVDLAELTRFAKRYAEAWCSLVTGHLSLVTSLISGYELWNIDNDGLIAESKGHFDTAEYERQLTGK